MAEVPYVQKRQGGSLGYSFAGERELIEKLRPAMVRHGITCRPTLMHMVSQGEYKTSNGKTMRFCCIVCTYMFSFGGESENVQVFGEAADTSDKALPKAMTLAQKYALRQFFLIETGDDPDVVAHHREDDNSDKFAKAARSIGEERRPEKLTRYEEVVKQRFTGSQLDDLLVLIDRQRSALPQSNKRGN